MFIRGDVRPANIMAQCQEDARIEVAGLADWEMSGFCLEDLRCVKALNNLSLIEKDDWCLILPECIAPRNGHLESWYADLDWGPYVDCRHAVMKHGFRNARPTVTDILQMLVS